jgi:outer membrane receptor protein involved in Fe transport
MKRFQIKQGLAGALRLLALALLVAGPAMAQNISSSIRGVVRDENGPIPGATIVAVDAQSGFTQTATAGEDGRFALDGLRPGTYELKVASEAYKEQTRSVQLLLGQDVEANFVLSVDSVYVESVTVTGEATQLLVDTRSSEVASNITTQQIEQLPQSSRNFLSFAALAPGIGFTDDENQTGKKFRSGGADARQVNVFVDGMSFKNDLLQGGAFMQDSSRGNPFPQNAVQEYRVLTQNYKAEYEKASAAVISAITKSGGNELKGDAFYLFQDKSMVTQDDFSKARGDKKADYERKQYGLSVGGPIVRDRVHFFLSYEANEQDRNATVFRGSDFGNAPADVQQFLSQFPLGVQTVPFSSDLYFGKLSWQPREGQTFEASYHLRDEQDVLDFGGQRPRQSATNFQVDTSALTARHTWVLGNALNEAGLTVQNIEWNPAALNSDAPRLNYIGILDIGKDATQDFTQDKVGLRDDFTWSAEWHGSQVLKGGLSYNKLDYEIEKTLFPNGLFEFRRDEQWEFPFQARIGFGNPSLKFSNDQYGLYLQDDWKVLSNLTVNLGVRWDYESNMINNDFVTPANVRNALQSACRTYGSPVGGKTTWCLPEFLDLNKYTTDGSDRDAYYGMVQPRLGFAWDLRGDARTVVFGGWGKYYDRVILNDIYDEAYRQQYKIYSFCFSADGTPARNCGNPTLQWNPAFLSREGLAGLVANGSTPGPEIWLVSNDMKPPRSEHTTLGVRQQFGRWLSSLSYVHTEGHNNLIEFFGDNPPGTAFNDRFGGNVSVPGFGRVFIASTTGRTWYDGVFLTLDRPWDGRWGFNLAYTYADASKNGQDNNSEGIQFGAFDYGGPQDLYKFPASNVDQNRLVMSGTVGLPFNLRVSSLITLGSGVPFTIFDDSGPTFKVRWNEGSREKKDFIIPNAWAYRSVDVRLDWDAPAIADRVRLGLTAEAFNVFDFDNVDAVEQFNPKPPAVSHLGEPRSEINTRRFQVGARVSF